MTVLFFPLSSGVHVVLEDHSARFVGVVVYKFWLLAGVTALHVRCDDFSNDTFLKVVRKINLALVVDVDFVFSSLFCFVSSCYADSTFGP